MKLVTRTLWIDCHNVIVHVGVKGPVPSAHLQQHVVKFPPEMRVRGMSYASALKLVQAALGSGQKPQEIHGMTPWFNPTPGDEVLTVGMDKGDQRGKRTRDALKSRNFERPLDARSYRSVVEDVYGTAMQTNGR